MAKRAPIVPKAEPKADPADQPAAASKKRPDQIGKRLIGAQFPEAVYRQFRVIAGEKGIGSNELLREALNDLFGKYHKDQIA
jgi:hypothetical protein